MMCFKSKRKYGKKYLKSAKLCSNKLFQCCSNVFQKRNSAQRKIYLHINKYIYFSYLFIYLIFFALPSNIMILYELFCNFLKFFLHVPICMLPIFGAHQFFGSTLPQMQPCRYTRRQTADCHKANFKCCTGKSYCLNH